MSHESPFTPGIPAAPAVFGGRTTELERLRSAIDSAIDGRPRFVYITGERGIGKSSLASFALTYARVRQNMVGTHVFLGGTKSVSELVRRVMDELLASSKEQGWFGQAKSLFGKVESVGLLGVSVRLVATNKDIQAVANRFGPALHSLTKALQKGKDPKAGLVIVLDDINGLSGQQKFCDWLKSTVDKLAVIDGRVPVVIIMVGIEERRAQMVGNVPSLGRVFDLITLDPWERSETEEFFRTRFKKVELRVEDDALDTMSRYCGDLPSLAHEIGDAVFRFASDSDAVTDEHAIDGLLRAAETIGSKYVRPQVVKAIRGQTYRAILAKLGAHGNPFDLNFTRAEFIESLGADEELQNNIDNFLSRLKTLGLITSGESRGSYQFVSHLARVYLWLLSVRT